MATGATAPDSFAASLARRYTRLGYNRVNKAGSTTMQRLLEVLAKRNNLTYRNDPYGYFPNASSYTIRLQALPERGVYVNHALLPPQSGSFEIDAGFAWINVVREPIARMNSQYYFIMDPSKGTGRVRPAWRAEVKKKIAAQERDPTCGCAYLEFDACVRKKHAANCTDACSFQTLLQYHFFCTARDFGSTDCTLDEAIQNLRSRYVFVGLTEELGLALAALEKMLPDFFGGASAASTQSRQERVTLLNNPITNTTQAGAVSSVVRQMLSKCPRYANELVFYQEAKRLFWRRVGLLGLLD